MKSLVVTGAVLVAALLAVGPAAAVKRAAVASPPIDVEVAVDTTGSMDVSIQNAKPLAAKLVAGLLGLDANARLAIVSFRDPGNPGGEYQVLQPMTADAASLSTAINALHTSHNPTPGNVAEESYNLAFHNSYSDGTIGWRSGSRKLVVVIGDAEPYGAGKAGLPGCHSQLADPHGFNTAHELAQMAKSGRTLLMVRESSHASTTLACYQSMAARSYGRGVAVDDPKSGDISAAVLGVVQSSLAPVETVATPIFAGAHAAARVSIRVRNPNAFGVTLQQISIGLAPGFTAPAATGWDAGGNGSLTSTPNVVVGAGKTYATTLALVAPAARATTAGTVTTSVALPDGHLIAPTAAIRSNTGSSFRLRVGSLSGASLGSVSLAFGAAGLSHGRAAGVLVLRGGRSAWRLHPTAVSLSQSGAAARLTLTGSWQSGSGCHARARLRLTLTAAFGAPAYAGTAAFVPPCGGRTVAMPASTVVG